MLDTFARGSKVAVAVDGQENVQAHVSICGESDRAEPVPEGFACSGEHFCGGRVAK